MKILMQLFFFILAAFLIVSCQKELNFDDLGSGTSVGTLKKDTTFDCFPVSVNGQYTTDSALTADNFIDVQVNISVTGAYTIQSDTVNGYSFKGTGILGAPGINTVRLYGTGTPILPTLDPFIIRYDTSFCFVDVNVDPSGVDAVYTFTGAGASCTSPVFSGVYMAGTPLDATNTVQVALQITTPGNYSITTTQINGVIFSASGTFTDTTPQSVILTGQGVPVASGPFTFPLLGNGTSCAFSLTFL